MGMADMLICDHLEELGNQIDCLHLIYLEQDDSPRKIEQREKLEHCIKEYLCLAPHDRKFAFRQTADVLHRSASTKDNFSAYRAGLAWKAVGKYADNLLAQPWRKEYREIKLYSGFYKHEVEESLVGAELMLEAMGYRHTGRSTMTLPDILDPDRIKNVSKDSIVAYVECEIMKQIWEAVSTRYNFSWLDILEFRENHTGTADQAIRALSYKARQRQYQEQLYHRPQYIHIPEVSATRPDCFYGQNLMGYNHMHYLNHSYTLPVQPRYAPIVSPQQVVPPPMVYQNPAPIPSSYSQSHTVLKSQELYPSNGYHMHPHYTQNPSHLSLNGYAGSVHMTPVMPTYTAPATVPTAQLIELDPLPSHMANSNSEFHAQRVLTQPTRNPHIERHIMLEHSNKNENHLPSGRARDDGAGSWENWDYVYRNLESQGYKKDMGPRGDILSPKNNHLVSSSDISEKMRRINLDSVVESVAPKKEVSPKPESLPRGRLEVEPDTLKSYNRDTIDYAEKCNEKIMKDHSSPCKINKSELLGANTIRTSPEKRNEEFRKSSDSSSCGISSTTMGSVKREIEPERAKQLNPVKRTIESDQRVIKKELEFNSTIESSQKTNTVTLNWECITCTYLNSPERDICEMCSKSKSRGAEERPQPSGGQECSRCTFVNDPGIQECTVCGNCLENSPTYI